MATTPPPTSRSSRRRRRRRPPGPGCCWSASALASGSARHGGADADRPVRPAALRRDRRRRGAGCPRRPTSSSPRAAWAWSRWLMSLVTVAWIVQALRNDDRGHALHGVRASRCCSAPPTSTCVVYGWQQLGPGRHQLDPGAAHLHDHRPARGHGRRRHAVPGGHGVPGRGRPAHRPVGRGRQRRRPVLVRDRRPCTPWSGTRSRSPSEASAMITTGSKWFFGLGFLSLVLAAAYGWTTGGNGLGPLSARLQGRRRRPLRLRHPAVGRRRQPRSSGSWPPPPATPRPRPSPRWPAPRRSPPVLPAGASYWPPVAAFGAALVVIGLVSEAVLVVFGLIVLGIVLVEWAVQTWADHATGDPETNRRIRNRLMNPIEYPAAGVLALGLLAIALLAAVPGLPAEPRCWVAHGRRRGHRRRRLLRRVARPGISSNVVVGLLVAGAVLVIGIGVAGGRRRPPRVPRARGRGARRGARAPSVPTGPP